MSLTNSHDKRARDQGTRRRPWSLARRLTLWYAGAAFGLLVISSLLLYWGLYRNLNREDDEYLAGRIRIISSLVQQQPLNRHALREEIDRERDASPAPRVLLRVMTSNGRVIAQTPKMGRMLGVGRFPHPVTFHDQVLSATNIRGKDGHAFRAAAATVPEVAGGQRYTIQAALDRDSEAELLSRYRLWLWAVLGFGFFASAVGGYQIARRGLQPLDAISQSLRRVRSQTLGERLQPGGWPTELAVLVETFNELLAHLDDAFSRLSSFSADIAHDLRTPIQNLRGEAEVALRQSRDPQHYRAVLASSLEECDRLTTLIDRLLFLARAEQPDMQISRERVDVREQLVELREFYDPLAEERGISLRHAPGDPVMAELDRRLFRQAMANLIENALAHTPNGGSIVLTASACDSKIQVQVQDTGSGIDEKDLPHVFDRFRRSTTGAPKTSGLGLGLAIVNSIVRFHGGRVDIDSTPGHGTIVRLTFPSGRPTATTAAT